MRSKLWLVDAERAIPRQDEPAFTLAENAALEATLIAALDQRDAAEEELDRLRSALLDLAARWEAAGRWPAACEIRAVLTGQGRRA
ncbi:MAG TPA: hypothetical protein VNW94_26970 [Streptosporangiaceae bacterium]|nr:hypothetical protein [Streptosporangiaceae bacterium]